MIVKQQKSAGPSAELQSFKSLYTESHSQQTFDCSFASLHGRNSIKSRIMDSGDLDLSRASPGQVLLRYCTVDF